MKKTLQYGLVMLISLLPLSATAVADEAKDSGDMTELEMRIVLKEDLDKAEAELDKKIAWVENRLYRENLVNFRKAQKAWEEYRKLQCDAQEHEYSGGTIAGAVVLICKERITKARKMVLDDIYVMLDGIHPKVDDE